MRTWPAKAIALILDTQRGRASVRRLLRLSSPDAQLDVIKLLLSDSSVVTRVPAELRSTLLTTWRDTVIAYVIANQGVLEELISRSESQVEEWLNEQYPQRAYRQETYGQEGEDLILLRYFEGHPPGYYVDVGAHHPIRFSNTYLLHRKGWRGINIDASEDAIAEFRKARPQDINLATAISIDGRTLEFFEYEEPALSTASPALVQQRRTSAPDRRLKRMVSMKSQRLDRVLEQHLPDSTAIGLLTIDVEGLDEEVVQSNDWDRFRPELVVVETLRTETSTKSLEDKFAAWGYRPFAKMFNTSVFQRAI